MELKNELKKFIVDRTTRYNVMAKSQEAAELAAAGGVIFGNLSADADQFSVYPEGMEGQDGLNLASKDNSTLDNIKAEVKRTGETQILIAVEGEGFITKDKWTGSNGAYSKDAVIGIAVITPLISFIVGLTEWKERWSEDDEHVVTESHTEAQAFQVVSGLEHTRQLVDWQEDEGNTAAKMCWNYKHKGLQWYLPCLLELNAICANKEEINVLLKLVGGTPLSLDECYWSSTEGSAGYSWGVYFGSGSSGNYGEYSTHVVRPAVAI